jgi:hypothetical protein
MGNLKLNSSWAHYQNMTCLAYIFMVSLLVLFSIVLISGILSGCGGGTSGPSVQSFSPQLRMSLAGFDN